MADLRRSQIRAIEEAMAYPRGYGYVLDFSDRTMQEFFDDEFGVDIFSPENRAHGSSLNAPNNAMYSDTYSAPLRAPSSARNRER